jgi:hypothetical protein
MTQKLKIFLILNFLLLSFCAYSQKATIRGSVFDKKTAEPVIYATLQLEGTGKGAATDIEGFFNIAEVEPGNYKVIVTYIGYDTLELDIKLSPGEIVNRRFFLEESSGVLLSQVEIKADKSRAKNEVLVSKVVVSPREIKLIPTATGEADIAQYLPVLPGIVTTGDQGGQIYIRGGSPVQNKMMLDGMIILSPVHSLGFFSVFETEAIRNVDVITGGFNAEHGGRTSAVVDIKTRDGNKKRFGGVVSTNPYMSKVLVEGPIIPLKEENGNALTFLLTGKTSYIDRVGPSLYSFIDDSEPFPYQFRDLYGKISFLAGNGTSFNLFGFDFNDNVNLSSSSSIGWKNKGIGGDMKIIPQNSNLIVNTKINFTDYKIQLDEEFDAPRISGINTYNFLFDFQYFGYKNEVNYGLDIVGVNTDYSFRNSVGTTIQERQDNFELGIYLKYKHILGNLIIEPGARVQYYTSLNNMTFEPRIGLKYNLNDNWRIKFAGGRYSQNLITTRNENDVVNFFNGFLAGQAGLLRGLDGERTNNNLQTAWHAIFGIEHDLTDRISLNIEPYVKYFDQMLSINRFKRTNADPNFIVEEGRATGIDFSAKYDYKNLYVWTTYSYAFVDRFDGFERYYTHFDRRHNLNFLTSYSLGEKKEWEMSFRWNLGTGFPFTRTQGFFGNNSFINDLIETDILGGNSDINVIFEQFRNRGRLPIYHRLDASVKRTVKLSGNKNLEINVSATNLYDRENIFYIDRITNNRVNQLPIIPAAGIKFSF